MARRSRSASAINLPPPYLRRVWIEREKIADPERYPFCLPLFREDFELRFESAVTIFVGENGVGKSTLIEAIAALAGYDDAGGGKGYRPVDHERALEASGGELAVALRAAWLPKITNGWFFKAESFFSVARYLDSTAREFGGPAPDFLSHSHGEGFLRVFEERCSRQGLYFFDEPESALSPSRQLVLLRLLERIQRNANAQVIMATHSPLLMALPEAKLLRITKAGIENVQLEDTDHFRLLRDFTNDPETFVREALESEEQV